MRDVMSAPRAPPCQLSNITHALQPGSAAARRYLMRTYGGRPPTPEAFASAETSVSSGNVDLVWTNHLPRSLASCEYAREPIGPRTMYSRINTALPDHPNASWIYHHTALTSHSDSGGMGPTGSVGRDYHDDVFGSNRWVEVFHAKNRDVRENSYYYMYLARGSGIWYWTGSAMSHRDHWQQYEHWNATTLAGERCEHCAAQQVRVLKYARKQGLDTVIFTSHVDSQPGRRAERGGHAYLTEVVALWLHPRQGSACPDNSSRATPYAAMSRFRAGWAGARRACRCDAKSRWLNCDQGPGQAPCC